MGVVKSIHNCNMKLWHLETHVRDRDESDVRVCEFKREIDNTNLRRNQLVEEADERFMACLSVEEPDSWEQFQMNSETFGQMIDRMSILILKAHFTNAEGEKPDSPPAIQDVCRRRVDILEKQLRYIAMCYNRFLLSLEDGSGFMLPYKQCKFYEGKDLEDRPYP